MSSQQPVYMSNWSSLKREAATLEQYINQRLSSSSSSSSTSSSSSPSIGPFSNTSSITVSIDSGSASSITTTGGSFLDLEAARLREVDESIMRLSAVVEKLSAIASASGQASQLIATSTLQGVIHELRTEQRRQAGSLRIQREAASLMMRNDGSMAIGSSGTNTMTDALLRERGALQGSHSALDEVLGRAAETQAALSRQRNAMSSATGRLGNISAKLPTLQDLMLAIQRRRSLNDYIVAGVIATCFLFTLWYMFGGSGTKSDSNNQNVVKKS